MTKEQAIKVLNMVESHGLADEAKKVAINALTESTYTVSGRYKCYDYLKGEFVTAFYQIVEAPDSGSAVRMVFGDILFTESRHERAVYMIEYQVTEDKND